MSDLCDGELGGPVEVRVRRHLAGCRRCRGVFARLEATIGEVGRLRSVTVADVADQRGGIERRIIDDPVGGAARDGGA